MPQRSPFVRRTVVFERALHERAARRPGPYESAYDVLHGYEAPPRVEVADEPPAPELLAGPRRERR